MSIFTDKLRAAADSLDKSEGIDWKAMGHSVVDGTKAAASAVGEKSINDLGRSAKNVAVSAVENARIATNAIRSNERS